MRSNAVHEALLSRLANLTDSAIVPALWLSEVVNVTGLAARKGRITEGKARAFRDSLADLPIEVEDAAQTRLFLSVLALGVRHKLTAYDASCLEPAIRRDLPIAALDNALTKAARESGVTLV